MNAQSLKPQPDLDMRRSPRSLRDAWIALAGLSAVFLFEMLDNSILNVALPTIGRDLHASNTALQWTTLAYTLMFGSLMLVFGAIADRFGRRRLMLIGLTLLGVASLATAFVTTAEQLILVRSVMGIAAAMTTPGSIALCFRLFEENSLRLRAITVITTVGLIGLAIGPTVGGLLLSVAPWQILLLINVPIAVVAFFGIRTGIVADHADELHPDPIDIIGAVLGTATIALALTSPSLFVSQGTDALVAWAAAGGAVLSAVLFYVHERGARYPLVDLNLVRRPLVSSGLAYEAATGLAIAGLGYMVTLQMQLDWGWSPARAALGMLPQVIVLIASGPFVEPFVERVGNVQAAALGAVGVVAGLGIFSLLSSFGYFWVAISLVLVSVGMRVVGVVAGFNVLRGLPEDRTSVGAALTDTSTEVASGIGIALTGSILAAVFSGSLASSDWNTHQTAEFQEAIRIAGLTLTFAAGALVGWAMLRSRESVVDQFDSAPELNGAGD